MQTEPDAVINEAIEKRLASDPRIKAAEEVAQAHAKEVVETAWLKANPEFFPNSVNGTRLYKEMARNGVTGVPTPQQIDSAYQSLKADGLLQATPPAVVVTPTVVPPVVAQPLRRTSTLSTRSTAVNAPNTSAPKQLTEQEMYDMPLEKLRELGGGGTSRW
jgi:hypothetical protein